MLSVRRALPWIACLVAVGLSAGCKKTAKTTAPPNPFPTPPGPPGGTPVDTSGPHAAGKQVFMANGCGRCHTVGSAGGGPMMPGRPGMKGPDLGTVGRDPAHTAEWIMGYVRNPRSYKEDSRMPPVPPQKLKDEDLRALAEYLASLK
jgi:mono/diheme cytochrome c family protein